MPSMIKVLLVDDSDDVLLMVSRFLRAQGMVATTTNAPFEVLERIRVDRPDVLVLDLMMPGLSGDAVARFAADGVPVIFYSAADDETLNNVRREHPHARIRRKGGPLRELAEAVRSAAQER